MNQPDKVFLDLI